MVESKSFGSRLFDVLNYALLFVLTVVFLYPLWYVLVGSISDPVRLFMHNGLLWRPLGFSLQGYRTMLQNPNVGIGYANTIFYVVVGTVLSIFFSCLGAYTLSRPKLMFKKLFTLLVVFTMYFSGGMIPNYLLINNWLKLSNTIWALILPPAMSAYNLIIVRNFFESIPDSLEESARIDGARETTVLFKIVVPLSMPVLATVSLWCIVGHWNAWYDCMLYIRDDTKYVLQYTLQRILLDGQVQDLDHIGTKVNTETMKMASIVVSILPIMIIYPFVQKYFTKGVMIGAVKG